VAGVALSDSGLYPFSYLVTEGGLASYGIDLADSFRQAPTMSTGYSTAKKPAEPAGSTATNLILAINLKTAKALGLTVPPSLLARADEVNRVKREFRDAIAQSASSRRTPGPITPGIRVQERSRPHRANRDDTAYGSRRPPGRRMV